MSFEIPLGGIVGTVARPKLDAFLKARRPGTVRCPLCWSKGSSVWAERHVDRAHILCSCGRWFLSVEQHLSGLERHGTAHLPILHQGGSES